MSVFPFARAFRNPFSVIDSPLSAFRRRGHVSD
jgi:hypothetical protein